MLLHRPCPGRRLPQPLQRQRFIRRLRTILYWYPEDGWQLGTVARICPRDAFSHVVAYIRQKTAL